MDVSDDIGNTVYRSNISLESVVNFLKFMSSQSGLRISTPNNGRMEKMLPNLGIGHKNG